MLTLKENIEDLNPWDIKLQEEPLMQGFLPGDTELTRRISRCKTHYRVKLLLRQLLGFAIMCYIDSGHTLYSSTVHGIPVRKSYIHAYYKY